MQPFDSYPEFGRRPLGRRRGDNSRRGYGLDLQLRTKQAQCAYCGVSLVDTFEHWLALSVDHVVPTKAAETIGVPLEWVDDYCNIVLCCTACNGFGNRYTLPEETACPVSFEEFLCLRDATFAVRKQAIAERRQDELEFYMTTPWSESAAQQCDGAGTARQRKEDRGERHRSDRHR